MPIKTNSVRQLDIFAKPGDVAVRLPKHRAENGHVMLAQDGGAKSGLLLLETARSPTPGLGHRVWPPRHWIGAGFLRK